MKDDVERMREIANQPFRDDCKEAADEIERLRETVRVLREECSRHERSLNDALAEVGRLAEAEALLRDAKDMVSRHLLSVTHIAGEDGIARPAPPLDLCMRADAWLAGRNK